MWKGSVHANGHYLSLATTIAMSSQNRFFSLNFGKNCPFGVNLHFFGIAVTLTYVFCQGLQKAPDLELYNSQWIFDRYKMCLSTTLVCVQCLLSSISSIDGL